MPRHGRHSSGQVLSFFGAKGGVGTTTVAIHLAISLVRLHGAKVLLVDNHPQFGHVCLYLGLEGAHYHFHEVVRNVDRLDSELLRGFIAHHAVGIDVLASPDTFNAVRPIDPDALVRTVEYLRGQYDYILLDCVDTFDENSLTMIDASDRFYLIATPDLGAVRNLSRYVDSLMRNEERSAKAQIVINRYSSQGARRHSPDRERAAPAGGDQAAQQLCGAGARVECGRAAVDQEEVRDFDAVPALGQRYRGGSASGGAQVQPRAPGVVVNGWPSGRYHGSGRGRP